MNRRGFLVSLAMVPGAAISPGVPIPWFRIMADAHHRWYWYARYWVEHRRLNTPWYQRMSGTRNY